MLVTLSGREHLLLRAWECDNGLLRWEVPTGLSTTSLASDYPLDQVWRPGGVSAILSGAKKGKYQQVSSPDFTLIMFMCVCACVCVCVCVSVTELVLVASDGVLLAFSMRSGKQLWKTSLPTGYV